jgi:hypothetical protein
MLNKFVLLECIVHGESITEVFVDLRWIKTPFHTFLLLLTMSVNNVFPMSFTVLKVSILTGLNRYKTMNEYIY